MLNIVIPMAGKSSFFGEEEYKFPKPLIEVHNKMMIEHVLNYLNSIKREKRFIFIINEHDARTNHLDNVIKLLTNNNCEIIYQYGDTKGATCSILLATEHINNEEPLIISNADQIIDRNLDEALTYFDGQNVDGGTICFESAHPQWSYVMVDKQTGNIIETAEKNPISKNAIAGFYYFRKGRDFVCAAMKSIEKDAHVKGKFFISTTFNELILEGKSLKFFPITNDEFHSFYSPEKIKEFENEHLRHRS